MLKKLLFTPLASLCLFISCTDNKPVPETVKNSEAKLFNFNLVKANDATIYVIGCLKQNKVTLNTPITDLVSPNAVTVTPYTGTCNAITGDADYNEADLGAYGVAYWLSKAFKTGMLEVGVACLPKLKQDDINNLIGNDGWAASFFL